MDNRFQIEEMVAQDGSGVWYRAVERESGREVAVRRFFPKGSEGGRLPMREQALFVSALERVAGVEHPGLRSVLAGGCDPVDGVPWVVMEWIDGRSLAEWTKEAALVPGQVVHVLATALELCAWLSHEFGQEGVWIETKLSSIVIGSPESERGVTFRASVSRWLRLGPRKRELQALAKLGQELLGCAGRVIADDAGDGLGRWLNWLRGHADNLSIGAVRESLDCFVRTGQVGGGQGGVVTSAGMSVTGAAKVAALPPVTRANGGAGRVLAWGLAAAAAVLAAVWVWQGLGTEGGGKQRAAAGQSATGKGGVALARNGPAGKPREATEAERVAAANARAAALQAEARSGADEVPAPPGEQQDNSRAAVAPAERGAMEFGVEQVEELMQLRGKTVTVEGTLQVVEASRDGKRVTLFFSKPDEKPVTFGILYVDPSEQSAVRTGLSEWVGKRVRILGRVDIDHTDRIHRPKILTKERSALRLATGA